MIFNSVCVCVFCGSYGLTSRGNNSDSCEDFEHLSLCFVLLNRIVVQTLERYRAVAVVVVADLINQLKKPWKCTAHVIPRRNLSWT